MMQMMLCRKLSCVGCVQSQVTSLCLLFAVAVIALQVNATASKYVCVHVCMCQQVLAREFGAVRHCREKQQLDQQGVTPAALAAATEAGTGTLAANTMTLLRHAFILIAGECLPWLQQIVILWQQRPPAVLSAAAGWCTAVYAAPVCQ